MKRLKTITVFLTLLLILSCDFFLGQDADTSPEGVLYSLWNDFNRKHAYINIKMDMNPNFDSWEEVYLHYNNLLSRGMNLFSVCGNMLRELSDPHVSIYDNEGHSITSNNGVISYGRGSSSSSRERTSIINMVRPFLADEGYINGAYPIIYGIFKNDPGIGYLYISSFSDISVFEDNLDNIVEYFNKNTKAVIIDVRYNYGGFAQVDEFVCSRFSSVQTNYVTASAKNGPGYNDFSSPAVFKIKPADNTYTKPIALITNGASISAAEWFTLAMRTQPHVIHTGTNTAGALSIMTMNPMINGWYYTISSYKVTDMNGKCYEGFGVSPDVTITGDEDDTWIVNPATQLEAVFDWFTKWLKDPQGEIK